MSDASTSVVTCFRHCSYRISLDIHRKCVVILILYYDVYTNPSVTATSDEKAHTLGKWQHSETLPVLNTRPNTRPRPIHGIIHHFTPCTPRDPSTALNNSSISGPPSSNIPSNESKLSSPSGSSSPISTFALWICTFALVGV